MNAGELFTGLADDPDLPMAMQDLMATIADYEPDAGISEDWREIVLAKIVASAYTAGYTVEDFQRDTGDAGYPTLLRVHVDSNMDREWLLVVEGEGYEDPDPKWRWEVAEAVLAWAMGFQREKLMTEQKEAN